MMVNVACPRSFVRCRSALGAGLALLGVLVAADAGAYQVSAQAGSAGQSSSTFSVDSASAAYVGAGEDGDYSASADAPSGALSASTAVGVNAFTGYPKRSAARIEERITFKSNPTGPVTVTVSLGFGGGADATVGSSVAAGQVGTTGYAGSCNVYSEVHSSLGANFIDGCASSPNTTGFPAGVEVVLSADQASFNDVLDVFGQVEAYVNSGGVGAAAASGTLQVLVEGAGGEQILYQFQNSDSFTVPEPSAAAAGFAITAALAALRSRRGQSPPPCPRHCSPASACSTSRRYSRAPTRRARRAATVRRSRPATE